MTRPARRPERPRGRANGFPSTGRSSAHEVRGCSLMTATLKLQANLKSSPDLIPIGEAARRLGVAASTLRYYDDHGLVAPAKRLGGRRWYGKSELRRLALIRMGQALGFSLD